MGQRPGLERRWPRIRAGELVELNLQRSGPWIGVGGLFAVLFIAFPTFLIAPAWGIVLVLALWLAQVGIVARWATRRPRWCPWVPAFGLVVQYLVTIAGARWWGWGF